jgi:hypothetical protein
MIGKIVECIDCVLVIRVNVDLCNERLDLRIKTL